MASALEVKFVQRKLLVTFPRFVDRFGPGGIGTVGPPGAPGAPGEPGSPGVQGPEGPEGPIGLTGPEGPQGAPGDDGAQGLQGIQGPEGLVGAAGPEGPQGVPGDDGAPGSAGADGAQGLQGIQGPAGPAGPDGLAGPQGVPGDDGAPGNAGADGAQGLQGIQGPAGPDGPIGPEGLVGPAGPAGGPVGPAGEPGADGAAGEQGIQGIQGPAGPEGPEGPAGPQGVPGADSVVEGPTGPEGPPGSPGEAGTTGIQGIQGVEGIPGPIGSGYVLIQFGSTTYNPADGVITYIGGKFQQSPRSLASQAAIVVPIAGTVVKWMVEAFCNVYASAETVNLSLRWNDTSDFSTLTDSWDVAYTTVVSGTISQAVAAGDTLAVKVVPPTWPGTNPTGVVLYGWILIKADGPAGEAGPAGPQGPAGIPGLGAPVAFKAQGDTSSPTQTMGPATWTFFTSAALNVEVFDTDGFYDLATGKFQPTVAGYYTITATAAVNNMAVGKTFQTMITKNGSTAAGSGRVWGIKTESYSAANPTISTALGVVYLNGTTDYCQLAGNQTDTVTLSTPAYDGWLSFAGVLLKAD